MGRRSIRRRIFRKPLPIRLAQNVITKEGGVHMTQIPYVTFMKHAQKVTKASSNSRPVLKGVIHRDGNLAVTDSHRLYFVSDAYEGEEKNVNPITGALLTDGNYPDVSRLIPGIDAMFSANIDVNKAAKAVKLIESAGKVDKASDLIVIERIDTDLIFATHVESFVDCRYIAGSKAEGEAFKITASAKYIAEGFALLNDVGLSEVTFSYFGKNRPFTFTGGNLTVLIMPVHTK